MAESKSRSAAAAASEGTEMAAAKNARGGGAAKNPEALKDKPTAYMAMACT